MIADAAIVNACSGCPMLSGDVDSGTGLYCGHPNTDEMLRIGEGDDANYMPTKCPLLKKPLLISADGGAS
jgi:hypothetical protein